MSVDLGQISYIDGVKIDWESGCSENYSIEVSNDNENWTTVKERLKSNTVAASDKHFIDNVMFDETLEARYIKEYFIDKEQKYVFAKHDLIKFIEKIIDLMIENTEEEIKNHWEIETKLMDLLRKIDQYNKDGIKYKIKRVI